MNLDRDLLAEIMADFESGADLPGNPFDIEGVVEVLPTVDPFITGGAIPDTLSRLHSSSSVSDGVHAGVVAGILQGLVIGYEYRRRRHR